MLLVLLVQLLACRSAPVGTELCSATRCVPMAQQLAVEVTPAPSAEGSVSRTSVTGVTLDDRGELWLTLARPLRLTGTVVRPTGTPVEGTLVLGRPSPIPGRPPLVWQASVSNTGTFELVVPVPESGAPDMLRFIATDPMAAPPLTRSVSLVEGSPLSLVLPDDSRLTTIEGAVVDALGAPLAGMRIVAIDPNSASIVSTTQVTASDGRFSLQLSEGVTAAELRAEPTPAAPGAAPTLLRPVVGAPGGLVRAELRVPALPAPERFSWRIVGDGPSGLDRPIAGARCQFLAEVTDTSVGAGTQMVARFERTSDSGQDGVVSVELLPGARTEARRYSVTIVPPPGSDFARLTRQLDLGPAGGVGADVVLQRRLALVGRVVDSTGLPVSDLRVQPLVAAPARLDSAASLAEPGTTGTALDGRFRVTVEPDAYTLGLIPATATMRPRLWLPARLFDQDVELGDLVLPQALVATVHLVDPDGNAVAGASVRVLDLSSLSSGIARPQADCPPDRCAAVAVPLGESSSGAEGAAPLLLPAQLRPTTSP